MTKKVVSIGTQTECLSCIEETRHNRHCVPSWTKDKYMIISEIIALCTSIDYPIHPILTSQLMNRLLETEGHVVSLELLCVYAGLHHGAAHMIDDEASRWYPNLLSGTCLTREENEIQFTSIFSTVANENTLYIGKRVNTKTGRTTVGLFKRINTSWCVQGPAVEFRLMTEDSAIKEWFNGGYRPNYGETRNGAGGILREWPGLVFKSHGHWATSPSGTWHLSGEGRIDECELSQLTRSQTGRWVYSPESKEAELGDKGVITLYGTDDWERTEEHGVYQISQDLCRMTGKGKKVFAKKGYIRTETGYWGNNPNGTWTLTRSGCITIITDSQQLSATGTWQLLNGSWQLVTGK